MASALPAQFTAHALDAGSHAERGDWTAAARAWRAAVALVPTHAKAWHNLGVVETRRGCFADALGAFAEAARLDPSWSEPSYGCGQVRFLQGDMDAAAASFEQALARDPGHLAAQVDLAQVRLRQRRYSAAVALLTRARERSPANEAIWWMLRGALLALGRDEEALRDFRAYEAVAPRSSRTVVSALASAQRMGDAAYEARALAEAPGWRYEAGDAALVSEVLARVQYFDVEPAALLALYDTYDALVGAELRSAAEPPLAAARDDDARLAIGYLSADFRGHVMGELLAGVVEAHDRARHRVALFSLAPPGHEDPTTARFRAASDAYVDLAGVDDAAAARAIAAAGLDVLVDLMGHSAFARPAILARKPARRIVTHLGYHGAVGLASVDAKISDRIADLPDGGRALRERLLRLDVCVLPLRPYRAPARRYERAALELAPDAIVIAAFVPAHKLSWRCLALWQRVLERVPRARLLFSPPRDDDRAALERRLAGSGIDRARVSYIPYEHAHRHDRYAVVDLALDTLPYSGGDTTAAALAAGVPVVTRIGVRHAERVSASILVHAGLDDLVAASDDAFVDLACRVAGDAALRADARARVRASFASPDLTDPVRYARALERALQRVLDEPPRTAA